MAGTFPLRAAGWVVAARRRCTAAPLLLQRSRAMTMPASSAGARPDRSSRPCGNSGKPAAHTGIGLPGPKADMHWLKSWRCRLRRESFATEAGSQFDGPMPVCASRQSAGSFASRPGQQANPVGEGSGRRGRSARGPSSRAACRGAIRQPRRQDGALRGQSELWCRTKAWASRAAWTVRSSSSRRPSRINSSRFSVDRM